MGRTLDKMLAMLPKARRERVERRYLELEEDPRFLRRIEQARSSLHVGRGVKLENLKED